MRLEQRRVLNADFSFVPNASLSLTHVDGQLSIREVSTHLEFDLAGSVWHDAGNSGLTVDNSTAGHSILSVEKSDLNTLSHGIAIQGADQTQALTLDTQTNGIDLHQMAGALSIQDFGDVHQVGSNTFSTHDLSISATDSVSLENSTIEDHFAATADHSVLFNGTIAADSAAITSSNGFIGGSGLISAATLDLHAATGIHGVDTDDSLAISATSISAINSGASDVRLSNASLLDASVHTLMTEEGNLSFAQSGGGSVTFDGEVHSGGQHGGNISLVSEDGLTIADSGDALHSGADIGGTLSIHDAIIHRNIVAGDGSIFIHGGGEDLLITGDLSATAAIDLSALRDVVIESSVSAHGAASDLTITADADSDGFGGFWLDEHPEAIDAQLHADHDITIVGSSLTATSDLSDSLRIDADHDAQQVVAGHDLNLRGSVGFGVSLAGDVVLDGRETAVEGSLTVIAHHHILLGADQTAGTDFVLNGGVRLTDDVAINAGRDVLVNGPLDDDGSDATSSALTITSGAAVTFVGEVGANVGDRLDALTVTSAGTVDFLNSVTLEGDLRVATTFGGIAPDGTVNFQGPVTTTAGLTGGLVEITNAGVLSISSQSDFSVAGSFTQNGDGTTELGADITTQGGGASFTRPILLTDSAVIDTSRTGGDITFLGTIDSEDSEHNSLTLSSGSGAISFYADLGAGVLGDQTLGDLTVLTAQSVAFGVIDDSSPGPFGPLSQILLDGAMDIGVGSNVIASGIDFNTSGGTLYLKTTDDAVRLNGAVSLLRSLDINTNATGEGGAVTFTSAATIDGAINESNGLTIDAGAARVVFNNNIGATNVIGTFTITQADAGVIFGESDTDQGPGTTGPVTIIASDGPIDIGVDDGVTNHVVIGGIVFNAGIDTLHISSLYGTVRLNGAVTLESAVDINTNANLSDIPGPQVGGTVTFTSAATIDSQDGEHNDLTIDAGEQQVLFNANLGAGVFGDQTLGNLTITQADSGVTFGESDTELSPGTTGPVTTIATGGAINIGVGTNVVGGTGIVLNGGSQTLHVTTTDDTVRFNGAVTLSSAVDIDTNFTLDTGGATVTFTSAATIDSEFGEHNGLTIDAGTQQVLFNNDLGATQSLGALTIIQADFGVRFGQAELSGESDLGQNNSEFGLVTVIATDDPIDIGVDAHVIEGGIVLNGGSNTLLLTTTDDTVRFNGPVTLASGVDINTNFTPNTGGATVTFTSAASIDSQYDQLSADDHLDGLLVNETNDLTIDAGVGQVLFNNDLGAVQSLGALTIKQADAGVIFGQSDTDLGPGTIGPVERIKADGEIDIGTGEHVIGGTGIVLNAGTGTLLLSTTDDNVRFNGAVTLMTSLDIDTTSEDGTGGGTVTFTESASIDSQEGEYANLMIDAGTQQVLFNNNIGELQSLGEFTIEQADGGVIFGQDATRQGPGTTGPVSIITVQGPIDIGVGAHVIEGDGIVFNAGDDTTLFITTGSDQPVLIQDEPPIPELPRPVRFNGAITLVSDVEITTTADGFGSLENPADPDLTTFIGGRTVIFTSSATIDSGPLGEAKSLTIDAGTQQVLFNNDIGAINPLAKLIVTQADRGVVFGESDTDQGPGTTGPVTTIATDDEIDIGVGSNVINAPVDPTDPDSNVVGIVFNAGDGTLAITTTDDPVRFNGPITLQTSLDINTNTGGIGGTVTFTSAATIDSDAVNDEHNDLVIDAGTEFVFFNNNIGATQSLGTFIITQADSGVFFGQNDQFQRPDSTGPVNQIITEGAIDIGVDSNIIEGGIQINGGLAPDGNTLVPVNITSNLDHIRFNGQVTSQVEPLDMDGNPVHLEEVDLTITAATGVELTGIAEDGDGNVLLDGGGIYTDDYNVVIQGDSDGDSVGDLVMGERTLIDAQHGYIDISAANVILGGLFSTSTNAVDATNPAIRVVATFGSIIDSSDSDEELTNITANATDSGVVLSAVLGIGSGNALETDIASLVAFNHDLDLSPMDGVIDSPADGNIEIRDVGTGIEHDVALDDNRQRVPSDVDSTDGLDDAHIGHVHNVDLIFVQNQANPIETGDTERGVIDINVENGDLRVVADGPRAVIVEDANGIQRVDIVADSPLPLLTELQVGIDDSNRAVPAVQSENTVRLTADTIQIFDDVQAIQDADSSGDDIFELIEINARADFFLADGRVISTDENFAGSLITSEDTNHNGLLDPGEDKNGNDTLDFSDPNRDIKPQTFADDIHADVIHITADTPRLQVSDEVHQVGTPVSEDRNDNGILDGTEDTNGNGLLDPKEDTNHNGVLDLTEDTNGNGVLDTYSVGRVFLGLGATISTDAGIEQQIAPRPEKLPSDKQHFIYTSDSAFFSGEIVASGLQSRTAGFSNQVYLATLTFTIGVPGEINLVLDIDWGDLTAPYQDNVLPPSIAVPTPATPNGAFVFDNLVDQHATRYLIPEGGVTYIIPHEYTQNSLNLQDEFGNMVEMPGRVHTSDPMQVRFSVSQHPSILVEGQTVLNPDTSGLGVPYVPRNTPYDNPSVPAVLTHEGLFALSSTDVSDDPEAFLPRFDNGVVAFIIPTAPSFSLPLNRDSVSPAPEPQRIFVSESTIVSPAQLTTETARGSAASSSVTTDEFFELRRINEDGSIESRERLTGDYDGELLLSNKDTFENFIRERGDGDYEIWFITKDTREGALIERPVIQFRLESGSLAPPVDESLKTFKPLKLIPVPAAPNPSDPDASGDGNADDNEDGDEESDSPSDSPAFIEDPSANLPKERTIPEESSDDIVDTDDSDEMSKIFQNPQNLELGLATDFDSHSSSAASIAAGVLVFGGTRRWKHRTSQTSSSLFSKTAFSKAARLARKLVVG